jgi:hypothetical protein
VVGAAIVLHQVIPSINGSGSADGYLPTLAGVGEREITGIASVDGTLITLAGVGERNITAIGSLAGYIPLVDGSGDWTAAPVIVDIPLATSRKVYLSWGETGYAFKSLVKDYFNRSTGSPGWSISPSYGDPVYHENNYISDDQFNYIEMVNKHELPKDQYAQFDIVAHDGPANSYYAGAYIGLRHTGTQGVDGKYYYAYISPSGGTSADQNMQVGIYSWSEADSSANTYAVLSLSADPIATWRIRAAGTSLWFDRDGEQLISASANLLSSGFAMFGVETYTPGYLWVDNFEAGWYDPDAFRFAPYEISLQSDDVVNKPFLSDVVSKGSFLNELTYAGVAMDDNTGRYTLMEDIVGKSVNIQGLNNG